MQAKWLLWCAALGGALLAVVAATQGFTAWTALLAVLLLVCPLLGLWVMRQSRRQARPEDPTGRAR